MYDHEAQVIAWWLYCAQSVGGSKKTDAVFEPPTTAVMSGATVGTTSGVAPLGCARPITHLVFALESPAVRSVVNVITAPDTDATTRSEPFGVAPQVCPDLSASRSFCPA